MRFDREKLTINSNLAEAQVFTVRSQPLGAITVSPDGRVQATSAKPSWLVQQRLVVPCCSWELSFQQSSNADNSSTMELLCCIVDYFAMMNMTHIDVYSLCDRCYVLMGHHPLSLLISSSYPYER